MCLQVSTGAGRSHPVSFLRAGVALKCDSCAVCYLKSSPSQCALCCAACSCKHHAHQACDSQCHQAKLCGVRSAMALSTMTVKGRWTRLAIASMAASPDLPAWVRKQRCILSFESPTKTKVSPARPRQQRDSVESGRCMQRFFHWHCQRGQCSVRGNRQQQRALARSTLAHCCACVTGEFVAVLVQTQQRMHARVSGVAGHQKAAQLWYAAEQVQLVGSCTKRGIYGCEGSDSGPRVKLSGGKLLLHVIARECRHGSRRQTTSIAIA